MLGYLSIGSNIGNRKKYLENALSELTLRKINILKKSSIYESLPFETDDFQGNYLNMAVMVSFDMGPFALLKDCLDIENKLGRIRPYRHAPRTLDIDILMVEHIFIRTDVLILPHPGIEKRAFVIWPLGEISPDMLLPSGRYIREVKESLKDSENLNIWKI
ncbi:MAG TPA: 2-amino-4-hydroxy-6-hydroxymethyldihydropteridine diphosphokinase [Desulfomonilia bacterium]|jgi:2-amino-4-hydroxy-6-hydroxymethyldihydropteridine diphosphokinase